MSLVAIFDMLDIYSDGFELVAGDWQEDGNTKPVVGSGFSPEYVSSCCLSVGSECSPLARLMGAA